MQADGPDLTEMLSKAMEPAIIAPWVLELGLRVHAATAGEVELHLPVRPALVHGGGVLCGQAIMAAADTVMVLAVMSKRGGFTPMTTVQLQTSFLKGIPAATDHVSVIGRVLRMGRNLVFGEMLIRTPSGDLCAHATTTYALL